MKDFFGRFNIFAKIAEIFRKKGFFGIVKDFFTKNLTAKILCFCAAVFLWFYVMDFESSTYEYTFKDVKIEYNENANGLSVQSSGADTVDVTLSGKRSVIKSMNSSDITVLADIKNITDAGNKNVEIIVSTSNETTVEKFEPHMVNVNIDRKDEQEINVIPSFKGRSEYEVVLDVSPEKIKISGPEKEVQNIAYAGARVDFSDEMLAKDRNFYNVELVLFDKNGYEIKSGFITMSQKTADVRISLHKEAVLPISVDISGYEEVYADDAISVTVDPSNVTIIGKKDIVGALSAVKTENIHIENIAALDSSELIFESGFVLPDGVFASDGQEKCTVSVKVKRFSEKIVDVPSDSISFLNLEKGITPVISDHDIRVRVAGVKEYVEQITASDIKIEINAANLFAGNNPDCECLVSIDGHDGLTNAFAQLADGQKVSVTLKNS